MNLALLWKIAFLYFWDFLIRSFHLLNVVKRCTNFCQQLYFSNISQCIEPLRCVKGFTKRKIVLCRMKIWLTFEIRHIYRSYLSFSLLNIEAKTAFRLVNIPSCYSRFLSSVKAKK